MKTLIKFTLLFSLFFCSRINAQKVHDMNSGPMADNTSFTGKRELRKEKRILKSERAHNRENERKLARSNRKFAGVHFGKHKYLKKQKGEPATKPEAIDKDKPKG